MARIEAVGLFGFAIDYLLLLSTNRLCGYGSSAGRVFLAACLGGVYGAICLVPGFAFLGSTMWCVIVLFLISWIAFGWGMGILRRGLIFAMLNMALFGIAMGFQSKGVWSVLCAGAVLCLMCRIGFGSKRLGTQFVPVDITYGNKCVHLTALADTGNTLKDPVTGRSVLIIGAQPARELTGLSLEQLRNPVEAITTAMIPGLRLIPYRSIGTNGFLLGLKIRDVAIDGKKGTTVVAFSSEKLDECEVYQALTGGAV